MLLALQDAGEDLRPVAQLLLELARKHAPRLGAVPEALAHVLHAACVEKCDIYRVMLCVGALFGNDGDRVVASTIRHRFPQPPGCFEKTGRMTGSPKVVNYLGTICSPNKIRGVKYPNL